MLAQQYIETHQEMHFHVWTRGTFKKLLQYCRRDLNCRFDIERLQQNDIEFIAVLRKTA